MQPTKITKTEPNKSPNQHHHPTNQHHHPTSGCHKSDQKKHKITDQQPISGQGKRENGQTTTQTNQPIASTQSDPPQKQQKITANTRASSGSEKHKGSVTHRSEAKRNRNQRVKAKSARGNRAKGEIGTGKPNQPTQATRSEVKGNKTHELQALNRRSQTEVRRRGRRSGEGPPLPRRAQLL